MSGATTANVLEGATAQVDAVTAGTRVVTLTVGGNDIQYSALTLTCGGSTGDCVPTLDVAAVDAAVAGLPARLGHVVAAVRQRAPDATVLLVTYPQVVPPEGAQCRALNLADDEARFVRELGQRLENVFLAVAKTANVVLVDAYAASSGHGPCASSGQSWIDGSKATIGFPFHPNRTGHQAIAALVVKALTNR